jgi:hypothetical protein
LLALLIRSRVMFCTGLPEVLVCKDLLGSSWGRIILLRMLLLEVRLRLLLLVTRIELVIFQGNRGGTRLV